MNGWADVADGLMCTRMVGSIHSTEITLPVICTLTMHRQVVRWLCMGECGWLLVEWMIFLPCVLSLEITIRVTKTTPIHFIIE